MMPFVDIAGNRVGVSVTDTHGTATQLNPEEAYGALQLTGRQAADRKRSGL